MDLSEQEAKDRLWRRETDRVGEGGHYLERRSPGSDTLIIDRYENVGDIAVVLAARFPANIAPLDAEVLATLAIESADSWITGGTVSATCLMPNATAL